MSENTTPTTPPSPPPPPPQSTVSVALLTTETFNLGEAAVGVADLFEANLTALKLQVQLCSYL